MDDIKAKQQVVEKIKEASKILVTVSNDPSVDALSAALGLTLLFDKQEKYATAVFSGEVPPAIAFLQPEKTFDETTDSLRDFIIALNKEKADHLRYKVEGDSVKIFITPYKTTISKDDLEFSQGDYNVELVIALGVDSQENLDHALENHGQILHDATVITVTAGEQSSNLGGIDWHDASASSLSEMIAGLAEAMKDDKKKSLVDAPIATALLTGIVAETDRFSNQHTTSKVMTVAAQLMAAGADQQLIATELQATPPQPEPASQTSEDTPENSNGVAEDGTLGNISIHKDSIKIDHQGETLSELEDRVDAKHEDHPAEHVSEPAEQPEEVTSIPEPVAEPLPEPVYEEQLPTPTDPIVEPAPVENPSPVPAAEPVAEPQFRPISETFVPTLPPVPTQPVSNPVSAYSPENEVEPSFGGTLNATTEQAADDARRLAMSDQNKTILSHAYLGDQSAQQDQPIGFPGTPPVAPGSVGVNAIGEEVHSAYALGDNQDGLPQDSAPTYGVGGGERVIAPLPSNDAPADLGLPLPPPLPDFSQGATAPPALPVFPAPNDQPFVPEPVQKPEILGDILAPEPTSAYAFEPIETPLPPKDPGQFRIPN